MTPREYRNNEQAHRETASARVLHRYSAEAVQREIDRDKRIGKREAKRIHALLRGPTPPLDDWAGSYLAAVKRARV